MKILTKWLRGWLPELPVSDAQLAEALTLRGIAVEGNYDLGEGNGSLYEMDITTNRVDAMNHYGVAREAAAIYGVELEPLSFPLPAAKPAVQPFSVRIEAEDVCGRFTARVLRDIDITSSRDWFPGAEVSTYFALLEQKRISNAVAATANPASGSTSTPFIHTIRPSTSSTGQTDRPVPVTRSRSSTSFTLRGPLL